jgi:hypothetical protein
MIIAGYDSDNRRYKLSLTRSKLRQIETNHEFFVYLKDLKKESTTLLSSMWKTTFPERISSGEEVASSLPTYTSTIAQLHSKRHDQGQWVHVELVKTEDGGTIGCTSFDKNTFAKILKAIKEAR